MPAKKTSTSKPDVITQSSLDLIRTLECEVARVRRNVESKLAQGAKIEPGRWKRIPEPPTESDIERYNRESERLHERYYRKTA